tara:strand:+ start:775 stop:1377 length:603 start_codon:yes stop_codon:yes gene_type:complete
MLRIVLAEDQSLLRGALASLLALETDFEILAQAADGRAAWDAVRRDHPDILVTDIEMPSMTGIELAEAIRREGLPTRVLIVTTYARPGYLRRAMDAGVGGYLLKDAPATDLAAAIRKVANGQCVIAPELAVDAWGQADPLTDTERRLLRLAESGLDSGAIAQASGLARGTVRNYLHAAIGKLGASNRIEAARTAREKGWL